MNLFGYFKLFGHYKVIAVGQFIYTSSVLFKDMLSLATYITANQCSHLTCRRFWARFPGLTSVKKKSKVLTVLKSTKLLHEHTIYLLLYVHACIYRATWFKKAWYCERNFEVCLVVIGIRHILKMEPIPHTRCHKI